METSYLISGDENGEDTVRAAAEDVFGDALLDLFFEHNQWWVTVEENSDGDTQIWSVVDASPGVSHGLDFELIG